MKRKLKSIEGGKITFPLKIGTGEIKSEQHLFYEIYSFFYFSEIQRRTELPLRHEDIAFGPLESHIKGFLEIMGAKEKEIDSLTKKITRTIDIFENNNRNEAKFLKTHAFLIGRNAAVTSKLDKAQSRLGREIRTEGARQIPKKRSPNLPSWKGGAGRLPRTRRKRPSPRRVK